MEIGVIEGVLRLKDQFSGTLNDAKKLLEEHGFKFQENSRKIESEVDKITKSYQRWAGAIDPVISGENKFQQAHTALSAALDKGIISQTLHNSLLEKAKAKFLDAGEGAKTFKQLLGDVYEVAGKAGGAAKELAEKLEVVTGKISGLGSIIGELGPLAPVLLAAAAAVVALAAGFEGLKILGEIIVEGMEVEKIINQLNNSLKANGGAAGYSASQMVEMADSLVDVAGVAAKVTVAGETILSRFTKIGHEVFPVATKASLDYAAATGKAPSEAFEKIGAALDGNVRSLKSLKDVGIVFSAAQTKTLQLMIDTNHIAEYQQYILDALAQHVGGAAEAYQRTLAGGISTAQAKMEQFKEGVASQIIPALERMFNSVVKGAGGWETIGYIVKLVSTKIGGAVRDVVDGINLAYHEMSAEQDTLIANLKEGLSSLIKFVLNAVVSILETIQKLPSALGGGDRWNGVIASVKNFRDTTVKSLSESAAAARTTAQQSVQAYLDVASAILKHKGALEGDDEVQKKHGDATDKVNAENSKTAGFLRDAKKASDDYALSLATLAEKHALSIRNSVALLTALDRGIESYETQKRLNEQTNAVEEVTIKLRKDHNDVIQKLTKAEEELNKAHDSAGAKKVADDIAVINAQYGTNLKLQQEQAQRDIALKQQVDVRLADTNAQISASIEQRKAEAAFADAKDRSSESSYQLGINLKIEDRIKKEGAGNTLLIILEEQARAKNLLTTQNQTLAEKNLQTATKAIADIQAKFADNQQLRQATQAYGKDVADILNKYGLLSEATKKLQIDQEAQAEFIAEHGQRPLDLVRAEIEAQHAKLEAVNATNAATEIAQKESEQFYTSLASALSSISTSLGGTNTAFGNLAGNFSKLITALDGVANYANKAERALSAAAAINIGAQIFKDLGIGGSGKTGGTSAFGGTLESNYAGIGSAVGTVIGAIIGAIVSWGTGTGPGAAIGGALGALLGGLISKAGDSASASLQSGGNVLIGETSDKLDGAVKDALSNIFKGLGDVLSKLGVSLQGMPLIDIKVRDNIVRVVVGNIVRTFSSMADAISFGISEAVKQIGVKGSHLLLPQEVVDALSHTTATDMTALQSDIDFAMKVANYGIPKVAQALNTSLSNFFEELHRDAELGIDASKSIANFIQTAAAQRDQILGINRNLSPADQMKADVAAYNQRAKLIIAQENVDKADILSKETELKAKIAFVQASLQINSVLYQAELGGLQAMEAALAAYDQSLVAIQAVLDGVILITDKQLADALRHLHSTAGSGAASARAQMNAELEKIARGSFGTATQAVYDLGAQLVDLAKRTKDTHASEVLLLEARQKLIDQTKQTIKGQISDFLLPGQGGTFGMSDSEKSASAIRKNFDDVRAANEKLLKDTGQRALAFWEINAAELRALNALAEDTIGKLGLPMEQSKAEIKGMADVLKFLNESLSSGAISAGRFAEVVGEISAKAGSELMGLAESLLNTMGQTQEAAKVKAALDKANFFLQVAQLNFLYTQYKALGLISAAVGKILDEALAIINDPALQAGIGNPPGTSMTAADYAAAVAQDKAMVAAGGTGSTSSTVQQALTLLQKYQTDTLDPLHKSIQSINTDFLSIRTALGNTPEVITAYNNAIQKAITDFLANIKKFQHDLQFGNLSTSDTLAKFNLAQADFLAARQQFASGNLSGISDIPAMIQNLLTLAQQVTPTGSQAYTSIFTDANRFLNQVLALTPAMATPLGGASNPMSVAGIQDIKAVSQSQLDQLGYITTASQSTAANLIEINQKLATPAPSLSRVV